MITDKQKGWVMHYIDTNNAAESARRAGYSPKGAYLQGHRMLRNDKIMEYKQKVVALIDAGRVLNIEDRKARLSELALEDNQSTTGVLARSPNIQAIDILNKMDKVYEQPTININDIKIQIIYEDTLEIGDGENV